MDLTLTTEQSELQAVLRDFFASESNEGRVRSVVERGDPYDRDLWMSMAQRLGLLELTVPKEYGGLGEAFVESVMVAEELGRVVACSPYVSTIGMATTAIVATADHDLSAEVLPAVAKGERVLTLVVPQEAPEGGGTSLSAFRDGTRWRIEGVADLVLDGLAADQILVLVDTEDGPALFLVDAEDSGVRRNRVDSIDITRPLARIEFAVTARRLAVAEAAEALVKRAIEVGSVYLAAEQIGGAAAALEDAVAYAGVRHQFGRAIGSFQSIKHLCADGLMKLETARSAVYYAARLIAGAPPDALGQASHMAKAVASDAFMEIAALNIQIHGGIGFTWEHRAHLYFRRAKATELLLGDARYHREQFARYMVDMEQ